MRHHATRKHVTPPPAEAGGFSSRCSRCGSTRRRVDELSTTWANPPADRPTALRNPSRASAGVPLFHPARPRTACGAVGKQRGPWTPAEIDEYEQLSARSDRLTALLADYAQTITDHPPEIRAANSDRDDSSGSKESAAQTL